MALSLADVMYVRNETIVLFPESGRRIQYDPTFIDITHRCSSMGRILSTYTQNVGSWTAGRAENTETRPLLPAEIKIKLFIQDTIL